MEDKQKIMDLLCKTLQATYNNLISLEYDDEKEIVTETFKSGKKLRIDVARDSDMEKIWEVMNHRSVEAAEWGCEEDIQEILDALAGTIQETDTDYEESPLSLLYREDKGEVIAIFKNQSPVHIRTGTTGMEIIRDVIKAL